MVQPTRSPGTLPACAAFAAFATAATFAVLSSCVTDRTLLPGPDPLPAPPAPASVRAYFRERYRPLAPLWDVLGPFPSPLDAMHRDLLIRQGGEARAVPAAGEISISPEVSATWKTVTAAVQDAWIPRAFRTRYATYVPLHAGKERFGPETALAIARVASPGGLHRFHLSARTRAISCPPK